MDLRNSSSPSSASAPIGWLVNNWIRARHGYALEDEWGGKTERADSQANAALRAENARLAERLEASEDRLAVLERIVTDRGYEVATQIEALRDQRPVDAHRKSRRRSDGSR